MKMSRKRSDHEDEVDKTKKQAKLETESISCWKINTRYLDENFRKQLHHAWNQKNQYSDAGLTLTQKPFCHCDMPDFIEDVGSLDHLQTELKDLEFVQKNNDLYKFLQTREDLKSASSPNIQAFRKLIYESFRDWLIEITGIPLNNTVDMFCAQYQHTDTLLCHDDELEGRRIAYIFYLVSNSWTEQDGGTLDLFNVDENIQPVDIIKSIVPARNSLLFFEVSPGSYHQVAEVLSEDKVRWSVGGWFHGPPIKRPSPYLEQPRKLLPYQSIEDDEFFSWVNPAYLEITTQSSIQEKFEDESEIELTDFLQAEKYEALKKALQSDMEWKKRGPANKRCYFEAQKENCPSIVKSCLDLFHSDAFFLVLSNLTGLKLHELAGSDSESENEEGARTEESKHSDKPCVPRCRSEVRRWQQGCYTLVHDTDTEGLEFALDLVLYVGCQVWETEYGGFTSYIARGEDEELLTVQPRENSLALVYRDKDTLKFVKHLSSGVNKMPNRGFYDISAVYFE